ncbi:hypothetical protein AB0K93_16050 [Streptomyces sp. NPDC052676]|uniref:hypothetical protein n=1 Tax=Streptomyces sp. NPDC052676 TaxID=3154953 RepID=UPI003413108E
MKLGKALATGVAEEQPRIQDDVTEVGVEAADLSPLTSEASEASPVEEAPAVR